jgi:pSer/pThr/pTyr-binding forkhead associated (FHA) protein
VLSKLLRIESITFLGRNVNDLDGWQQILRVLAAPSKIRSVPITGSRLKEFWGKFCPMKKRRVARFEGILQRLVEGTFARLFAGRLRPLEVANALADAMEDHAIYEAGARPKAPNHYWVTVHPDDYSALLEQQPDLSDDLARHLFDMADQLGYALPYTPTVSLTAQASTPLHQVRVSARWLPLEDQTAEEEGGITRQMPVAKRQSSDDEEPPPTRPFLILEGQRHIPLLRATVSLGRSFDNDIIVDDARVSRHHAQLRRRYARYVIFDLGSTGGTTVNGYPVQECVLEAGDVISLAGVEIIYGEDTPTPTPPPGETGGTPAWRRSSLPETGQLPRASSSPSET